MTAVMPTVMTQAEAARVTDEIRTTGDRLWTLLLHAYEHGAWAALGYGSWQTYATAEFSMSRSRAYQLLDAARVNLAIAEAAQSTDVDVTEAQARDIKPVLGEVVDVIAARTADADPEDVPTIVRDVITDARNGDRPAGPRPFTDRYDLAVADLRRVIKRLEDLHSDDSFKGTHRPSLGRRHGATVEAAASTLETVAKDLRLGRGAS